MQHREQEILYVARGQGQLRSGNRRWPLREGLAVLIPPGIEHQLLNEGEDSLTLLLLTELCDSTVKLRADILVRDRRDLPYAEPMIEWNYSAKMLFGPEDGLHPNEHLLLVTMEPMTLVAPHPRPSHWEELWLKLSLESSFAFLGSKVRVQQPNSAFLVPPNGKTVLGCEPYGQAAPLVTISNWCRAAGFTLSSTERAMLLLRLELQPPSAWRRRLSG